MKCMFVFAVPLSVYVFTLPLPYIGVASSLPAGFIMGVVVLVIGMLLYTWTPPVSTTTSSSAVAISWGNVMQISHHSSQEGLAFVQFWAITCNGC